MKAAMTLEQVGIAILVVAAVGILIWILLGGTREFNRNIEATSGTFRQATSVCKLQSVFGQGDTDNDGFANKCDICLGGNDEKDADNDGIPDACDADKDQKFTMKASIEAKTKELKQAGLSDKDALKKAVLLECENSPYSFADQGKEICCTAKFWNGKTCGITT